jgi:ubiquinone/menaquinone biosynthesis C-methylase UbiE
MNTPTRASRPVSNFTFIQAQDHEYLRFHENYSDIVTMSQIDVILAANSGETE